MYPCTIAKIFFILLYSGAKNMDAIFFDECWVFHHNLGIWTKLKNAGEKVSAASHCWMFQRSDGKIFVGGGYRSHQAYAFISDLILSDY